ncbi:VPA1269 family protein [Pseudomonas multiresinivorans]|uniref:Integrase n=1 Tax=Pseudomonas multiresinivorans TaxID=95301 RepID=A0A7Z3BNA0_9PSED|nr:VPA1269 family protein [Pseudomonas multiresinivorans]QJP10018.1 hypothetical protein G4G71_19760 [Pseudomonas multiresinivorans]
MKGRYYTFSEASRVVRKLSIRTLKEYTRRRHEDPMLPPRPYSYYTEWRGELDFLGKSFYPSLKEAAVAVRLLNIKTISEYQSRYREDPLLPAAPDQFYRADWIGYPEFFGVPRKVDYKTFEEAAKSARSLGVRTKAEYKKRYSEDPYLPCHPERLYKSEWNGYGDFLSGVKKPQPYETLAEASESARRLKIKTREEYESRYKEDSRLPYKPWSLYKKEWKDFRDFLGTGESRFYASLTEASSAAKALGISSVLEYDNKYKQDPRLPSHPDYVYSNEWESWRVFLFVEVPVTYEDISSASKAAKKIGIKSRADYVAHCRLDLRLPLEPAVEYKDSWGGWEEFLGISESVAKAGYFPSYEDARAVIRRVSVSTRDAYLVTVAMDSRFPLSPEKYYKEFWRGWDDFLGAELLEGEYATYAVAREAAQKFNFKNHYEYAKNCKRFDPRLPDNPKECYFNDWRSWSDYLKGSRRINPYSLKEASLRAIELGARSSAEYLKACKLDNMLPLNPAVAFKSQWAGWSSFLELPPRFYESLSSASAAAKQLGIKTYTEYRTRFREDGRLPAYPAKIYPSEWKGFSHFIGAEEKYSTLAEASEAAQKLGFTSAAAYKAGYKADPKLPARPEFTYKSEWRTWGVFFGLVGKYSYREAGAVARRLGVFSYSDYRILQCQDSRLPSLAPVYYGKEWLGWEDFLLPSKVENLADVKYAVKVLKIKNSKDYRERYKDYPCLPANPDRVFSGEWVDWYDLCDIPRPYSYDELRFLVIDGGVTGELMYKQFAIDRKDPRIPRDPATVYKEQWKSWYEFTGKAEPFRVGFIRAPYLSWANYLSEFLEVTRSRPTKETNLCRFVRDFIQKYDFGYSPLVFYTAQRIDLSLFSEFLYSVPGGNAQNILSSVKEFSEFILREKLTLEDEETGEVVLVPGAVNPFISFSYDGEDSSSKAGETNKPALAYQYVQALNNWMVPDDARSFADLAHLHEYDADWFEVHPSLIDKSDPDCVYKEEAGRTKMWYPGFWMHTLALASVPARGRQLAYNDSGEADDEIPKVVDGKIVWVRNDSPLAGMTKSQGFVKKFPDGIGMQFTSNKTASRGEGYDVAWMPEKLAIWMIRFRDWQAKYNPIKRVMPWIECVNTELNKAQLKRKGANCFLFRDFGGEECGVYSLRLKCRLAIALYHSQPTGIALAECRGNPRAVTSYDTKYTPHSMRVSLITAYIMEFGLPIEIVMKIAGHSNIVMSIYYVKLNAEGLRVRFAEGEKRALSNKVYAAIQMLEQNRIEELRSELIHNNEQAIQRFTGTALPGSLLFRDYGFCPFAGTRCEDGGPEIKSTRVREPINGGHLGMQNCIRCRHFVTGPVFIGGLLSLANEISLQTSIQFEHIEGLNEKIDGISQAIDDLDDAQYDAEKSGNKFDASERATLEMKCRKLKSEIESASKKADLYLCDLQAVTRLINQSQAVMNEQVSTEENNNLPQLIIQSGHELEVAFEESSRFHLLSEVCENAEIYESASAALALPTRSQMLDKMIELNHMTPKMFTLDKEQQLVLGNQLTKLFLSRVKSWSKVDALIEGKLMLADLAEHERIEPKDIAEILGRGHRLIAGDAQRALEGELL